MLPCAFKSPPGCFGKFPLKYFFVHIHIDRVCIHLFACACTLFSDHPAPAHSNTVMLLILFLHFLPIVGLFQGTNPASFLSQSSLLASAVCGQLVSCSSPLASEKQPSLQPAAGCSSFEVLLARLRSTRLASLHCLREDLNKSKMYLPFTASNPLNSYLLNAISWERA